MACAARVSAFGTLTVDFLVTHDHKILVPQTQFQMPKVTLNKPDPPPGLVSAGQHDAETGALVTGGAISASIPLGGTYGGHINSKVGFQYSMEFFADCAGPHCVRGTVRGIEGTIRFEYPLAVIPDFSLVKSPITSPDLSFGTECKEPKWERYCAGEEKVKMKLKDHELVPGKFQLTIDGHARVEYEVWHRRP